MGRSIIPRDDVFFDEFDKICGLIVEGVGELKTLLDEGSPFEQRARKVKTIEHESDEVVHTAIEHLHKTFITPFDRSDIQRLVGRLDDVLDLAEGAASRIEQYQPKEVIPDAKELVVVLLQSVELVKEMIALLRHLKKEARRILALAVEVNRLENEADHVRRTATARLFREEKDVFELIKWKEILEFIEGATDRCEDVSDLIQGIVMEHT